jgi:two-component system, NarL family, sensor histidine kinase UhpB
LRSALASLIQRVSEGTGVTIERYLDVALPPLSPDVELVVYRIAQEALTNAMRHSAASRVEVHLRRTTGGVRLRVRDHGIGLRRAAGPGGGLRGMRERAIMVGGSLRVQSCHGAGVDVCLDVDAKEPL